MSRPSSAIDEVYMRVSDQREKKMLGVILKINERLKKERKEIDKGQRSLQ